MIIQLKYLNYLACQELDSKYYGLFMILKYIRIQAYQLDLIEILQKIYNDFHISLLQLYYIVEGYTSLIPPLIIIDCKEQAEINKILYNQIHYGKLQYLVKQLEYSILDNKYILAENLGASKKYVTKFYQKYSSKPLPENLYKKK